MAAFRESDLRYVDGAGQERDALDWAILQNGPVALFHNPAVLDDAVTWLARRGYTAAVADCGTNPSKQGVLDAITVALGFPEGATLWGLTDYLWQLEVPEHGGFALVLLHYDRVLAADWEVGEPVLDFLAASAWPKMLLGRRLAFLVQSDDPNLYIRAVGGWVPKWNPREWSDKDRGL